MDPERFAIDTFLAAGLTPEQAAKLAEMAGLAGQLQDEAKLEKRATKLLELARSWGADRGIEKAMPVAMVFIVASAALLRSATEGTPMERGAGAVLNVWVKHAWEGVVR